MSDNGLVKTLTFFDNLGYSYTARFAMKSTGTDGKYTVELEKILNSDGTTFYDAETKKTQDGKTVNVEDIFGKKETNITLGTYKQVQSGYFLAADGKIYVGSSADNNKLLTYDDASKSFKCKDGSGSYSLKQVYGISDAMQSKINPPTGTTATVTATVNPGTGVLTLTGDVTDYEIAFSTKDGTFSGVGERDTYNADGSVNKAGSKANTVTLNMSKLGNNPTQFDDITIDFSGLKDADNGGKSTAVMSTGSIDDGVTGKGKKLGAMIGISIDNNGLITGTYDNGNTETLGQIAVAQFANASGLEKVGENCYRTTLNSGEFDGIGVEISADGSSMTSGELEMSNVDLSTEFTQMIITQRGFQANSRIITTSDTLLEELVNLKR